MKGHKFYLIIEFFVKHSFHFYDEGKIGYENSSLWSIETGVQSKLHPQNVLKGLCTAVFTEKIDEHLTDYL